jgi:integrase
MSIGLDDIQRAKDKAKSDNKPVKMSVGDGVRLNITKSSAVFQLRYRFKVDGKSKERTLTLTKLTAKTDVTLAKSITKAMSLADDAKALIREGKDPTKEKHISQKSNAQQQALTLKTYFGTWIKRVSKSAQWSEKHHTDMEAKFRKFILPFVTDIPLNRISKTDISKVLEDLIDRPPTYKKVRSLLMMVLDDAVIAGRLEVNPTPNKSSNSVSRYKATNLPALTSFPDLKNLIAQLNRVNIQPNVRVASLLQAHTVLRSATVVAAKWQEFDFDEGIWRIPRDKGRIKLSDKKKYGDKFDVPLSDEVILMLIDWRKSIRWHSGDYLFPSNAKTGHITIEAITKVYKKRLNTDSHCAHGWRSSFSTLSHEATDENNEAKFRPDVIERSLDHVVGNAVTQAYNRSDLTNLRRPLMNWWSKTLSDQ